MPELPDDLRGTIAGAVDKAVLAGHRIGSGRYGIRERYDADMTLQVEALPGAQYVCPMGAAAMAAHPLEKKDARKAIKGERPEAVIGCMLGVPPDYVLAFAMGFDGRRKWAGLKYDDDFERGYADGQALRDHIPPGASVTLGAAADAIRDEEEASPQGQKEAEPPPARKRGPGPEPGRKRGKVAAGKGGRAARRARR